jgi:hypothetical protein
MRGDILMTELDRHFWQTKAQLSRSLTAEKVEPSRWPPQPSEPRPTRVKMRTATSMGRRRRGSVEWSLALAAASRFCRIPTRDWLRPAPFFVGVLGVLGTEDSDGGECVGGDVRGLCTRVSTMSSFSPFRLADVRSVRFWSVAARRTASCKRVCELIVLRESEFLE